MAKPTKPQVLRLHNSIGRFLTSKPMLQARAELASNPSLRKGAAADPRGFLRKQGVKVPRALQVKISVTVRICITVCGRLGPVTVCVTVCGEIRF